MRSKIRRHLGLLFDETAAVELAPRAALLATSKTAARGQKKSLVPVEFTPHRYAIFLLHIAAEIEHLDRPPEIVKRMGAPSRKRVVDNFTWDHYRARLLGAYETAIKMAR